MHNGHLTWESTSNDFVLFKATNGAWQLDRTVEIDIKNEVDTDCPSSAQSALVPVRISSQDG